MNLKNLKTPNCKMSMGNKTNVTNGVTYKLPIDKKFSKNPTNLYGNEKVNNHLIHYGEGGKNALKAQGLKYNFKFLYKLPENGLKICSAGLMTLMIL